jgi:SAM-dependent methyltransferase
MIEETEGFDAEWLALREPFDALARSERLAARLAAALPARPRLLDLGAGTGSLLRWLAPRMPRPQAWTLVDSDRALTEAAFDTIADRAEGVGLKVTMPNRRTLLVHAPGGAWRVEALIADLAEGPLNLPQHDADAVLSSALCDLVSARWVESMAAAIGQDHGVDVAVTDIESSIIKGSGTMLAGGKRISIEPYLERVKKDIVPDVVGTVIAKVRQMGRSPDRVVLVGGGAPFYSGKVAEMYGADIVRTLEDPVSANARGFYFYGCQQVSEG